MILKQICLYLLLILLTNKGQSQSSFVKATIINNQNDSIQGYIYYQNWLTNPDEIVFKKTLSDKSKTIFPKEIKAFIVNKDVYETHKVKLEAELKETVDEIPLMGFTTSADTTIFLRCHVKGSFNLYSHSTSNGKSALYINKGNDTLQLLTYRKKASVKMGNLRVGMYEGYKRQLLKNLYDYPELSKKIIKANYSIFDIQNIIVEYNKHFSDKEPITYIAAPQKGKFEIHLLAGGNYSFLKMVSEPTFLTTRRIPNQTITGHGFDFGISAQWFLARQFNKVSFAADLEFKTMRLFNNYADNTVSSQTNFDNSYLRLYTQGRNLFFQNKHFSLAVNAGIVHSYTLKKNNNFVKTTTVTKAEGILFPSEDFKQFNLGFTAGLQLRINKVLALELRGETNRGMSPYNSVFSRLSSLNMFISYRLY